MSTRGLMGVHVDKQDKLTYCHSDSYPTGWPSDMVNEIRTLLAEQGIERMRELARAVRQMPEDSYPTAEELAIARLPREISDSPGRQDWYGTLRGLHGRFKRTLELGYMLESNTFIRDSLFCEWAYIANLDDKLFEVYQGFQKHLHDKGRFAWMPPSTAASGAYFPCALIATFPLDAIPKDWIARLPVAKELI